MGYTFIPIFFIGVDNDLGIGLSFEDVPALFQDGAYSLKVIDFSVIHHPDVACFIRNRLLPGVQVDDTEAAHGKAGLSVLIIAFIIWSAVVNGIVHPL